MLEKRLGKIDFAEFGSMKDYPFQLGLQLGFSMSGNGIMDGGKYTVNMSPDCHWEMGTRHTNLAESLDHDYLCFRKTIGQNHISDSAIRRYRRGHCGADLPDGEIHR